MNLADAVWIALFVAAGGLVVSVAGVSVGAPLLTYVGASISSTALGWLLLRAAILSALRQARSEE